MLTATSRRSFLAFGAAATLGTALPDVFAAEGNAWATSLGASTAIASIHRGDFTVEHYVAALIEQQTRYKRLNLFIASNDAGALTAAQALDRKRKAGHTLGALAGIPLLIKDNIETVKLPTTAGTPALQDFRPAHDAPILTRLFDADALLLGKTNMHELAMGVTSENALFGAVRNPYDPERIPGGSSGGTAAGIAARISPLGLGTDTGGSGRIPASLCGVAGFRPSIGRYPSGGVIPSSHTRDTVAPMGRTVADVELLDRVLTRRAATPAPSLAGVRLGLPKSYFWSQVDPEVLSLANESVRRLRERGCIFVEVDLDGLSELLDQIAPILVHEVISDLADFLRSNHLPISVAELVSQIRSPDVAAIYKAFLAAGDIEPAYRQAVDVYRPQLQALYAQCFQTHAIEGLLFPATPVTAPVIGADSVSLAGQPMPLMGALFHDDNPASAAGLPALVIPAGLVTGLPLGMELDGPVGSDARLLALGRAIEKVLGPMPAPKLFLNS